MDDQIILKKQKYRTNDNYYRLRVSGEAYSAIEELSEKTNMSMTEIANKMLMFALSHTKVEGDKEA